MGETGTHSSYGSSGMSVEKLFDGVGKLAGLLGGLGVLAILAMSSFEIISRYFFGEPTYWSVELSTYVLIAVAYCGAAYAHSLGANVRVTLLLDSLQPPVRRTLETSTAWGSILFVLVASAQTYDFILKNYFNGTKSYIMLVPQWIPNLSIFVGLILLVLAILGEIRRLSGSRPVWRELAAPMLFALAILTIVLLGPNPPKLWSGRIDTELAVILVFWMFAILSWSGWRMLLATAAVTVLPAGLFYFGNGLGASSTAALLFALVIASFLIGYRIGFGLGLIAMLSLYFLLPFALPSTIAERAFTSLESFSLTSLPMFVLMGALLVRSGIARELFDTLLKWMGRLPGGIAHAAMGACSVFAAVSGSSIATAATIGGVACPEMIRNGYSPRLAYGSVAAGGTLGILIPPSAPLIIYGTLASVSISKLFIGAMIPGLALTMLFMGVIWLWSVIDREAVPKGDPVPLGVRMNSLKGAVPFALLIASVLGSLYLGVVTPTEAGALGAVMAAVLCLLRGLFSFRLFWAAVLEAVMVTGFILLIVFAASLLTFIFDFLRISQTILAVSTDAGLGPFTVFLILAVFYIVLGMFLDSISLITLTLPVVMPLVLSLGLDPVWFGIVLVLLVEIGLITPPIGLNLFVLQGVGKISLRDVSLGAVPFGTVMVLFLFLLYFVPSLVTWLPELVK